MNLSKWSFDKSQVIDQKNIVSDLSLIDQARAYDRQRVQAKINKDEQAINEAAKQGEATGSVNPAVDPSYSGGTANPHTDTGWSGSEKSSSTKGGSYDRGNHGGHGHHWADGGRVGLRYGGLLSIL